MPVLRIGRRRIPYTVRESARALRQRIEATPAGVAVIVPAGTPDSEVTRFVDSRRRWIHDKTEELKEAVARLNARTPTGYHSGAKVLFRGRFLKLRVQESPAVSRPSLEYRTGFMVRLPVGLSETERVDAVRTLIDDWIEHRILEDAHSIIRHHGSAEGLVPQTVVVRDQKTVWGSCGRDRVLRLDRKLSRVPRSVFEYVVVHEICHLRHRDHSAAFWALVRDLLPDYEERKGWLERHEVEVG